MAKILINNLLKATGYIHKAQRESIEPHSSFFPSDLINISHQFKYSSHIIADNLASGQFVNINHSNKPCNMHGYVLLQYYAGVPNEMTTQSIWTEMDMGV